MSAVTIPTPDGSLRVFGGLDLIERGSPLADRHEANFEMFERLVMLDDNGPLRDWVEPFMERVDRWDFGWMLGRYVHGDLPANRNGHIFRTEELQAAHRLVPFTPVNMLHQAKYVIGTTVASKMIEPVPGTSNATGEPDTPWVETLLVEWRSVFPDEYRAIKNATSKGEASISMECWPESINCGQCDAEFPFAGARSETYTCGHLDTHAAPKWLNRPHFVGTGIVLPPARPGWKDAAIKRVAAFVETDGDAAQHIYEQVAAAYDELEPRAWEELMGLFLEASGYTDPLESKKVVAPGAPAAVELDAPTHAGVAVIAADTGRVLLLQRALDPTGEDPAAGCWEFPGGGIDEGETPLEAATREFAEEVGVPLPPGTLGPSWVSPNGVYRGFIYGIAEEALVEINLQEGRALNPDDPDEDNVEVVAFWSLELLAEMPQLRQEVRASTPWRLLVEWAHFADKDGNVGPKPGEVAAAAAREALIGRFKFSSPAHQFAATVNDVLGSLTT